MDECRICLVKKRKLISILEKDKTTDLSYSAMMMGLANIMTNSEHYNMICLRCVEKLKGAYIFKKLIEKSDASLNAKNNLKRIMFDDLNDILIEVQIDNMYQPLIPKSEDFTQYFTDDLDQVVYGDVEIKKVLKDEARSDSDLDFPLDDPEDVDFNPDQDDFDYLDDRDSAPDLEESKWERLPRTTRSGGCKWGRQTEAQYYEDADYEPPTTKVRKSKPKKNKSNKVKTATEKNEKTQTPESHVVCIKPVSLRDVGFVYDIPRRKIVRRKKESSKNIPTVCPYCGLMTKNMQTHLLQHTGERKFNCEICSKKFFTLANLNNHMKKHLNPKEFKCDFCVAAFNEKRALESHMISHMDVKKFVCDICNKPFKRRGALRRHQIGHSSANKTVMCEVCNMSFFSKYGLRHHMRVHTGERPYNCEICSQPYSYKHDFNRHCFKKHGVFLKRRSVYVMNEEVLRQEKLLMRELMLRVTGIVKEKPINPFEGPQAAQAFEQAIKAIENRQIPIDFF